MKTEIENEVLKGKTATESDLSESRPGVKVLVVDPSRWGFSLEQMQIGDTHQYKIKGDNGYERKDLTFINKGDWLFGYQNAKANSGAARSAIVSVLRCVRASDGNTIEFEKVYHLNKAILIGDLKKDKVLKNASPVKSNFQGCAFTLTKPAVVALAEIMKANDPYVVSMINAAGGSDIERPRNLIMFGAPGTGKSFKLEEDRKNHFPKNYERVTFYPTYSYAQFVGTYKPVMKPIIGKEGQEERDANGNVKEDISYEFVPGPFLRVLVKALNNPGENWCLIIEEINRANAAAVFGDVFQLLDRGSNGLSEYSVAASEDVKKYLKDNKLYVEHLKIPANMYIWATMNSADQGVFPMDTAFKRRWAFEYIGVDDEAKEDENHKPKCLTWKVGTHDYKWDNVRRVINGLLSANGVNEDKLMGPYFIQPATKEETSITLDAFSSKVLMYLWEDAGRMVRRKLFGDDINTYSKLVKKWSEEKVGIRVFEDAVKRDKDKLDKQDKDIRNYYNDLVGKSGDSGGSST